MYKRAAIIFFFFFSRSLLRNNLYNKSQLSLLAASSKFHKNSQRIVSSITLLFTVKIYCARSVRKLYLNSIGSNLLCALSPETLFEFDWFMFTVRAQSGNFIWIRLVHVYCARSVRKLYLNSIGSCLLCALSPETLFEFDWFMFLFWSYSFTWWSFQESCLLYDWLLTAYCEIMSKRKLSNIDEIVNYTIRLLWKGERRKLRWWRWIG